MNSLFRMFTLLLLTTGIASTLAGQEFVISKYDLSNFAPYTTDTYFAESDNGDIWVLFRSSFTGEQNDYVLKFDGTTWEAVPFGFCNSTCIHRIANSPDGRIYLGSSSGIFAWDGSNWEQLTDHPTAPGTDMAFDTDGNLWFRSGNATNPLAVLSTDNVVTPHPLVSGTFWRLNTSSDGKVWYIPAGGQLHAYDGTSVVVYSQILCPMFLQTSTDNKIWVATCTREVSLIEDGAVTSTNALPGVVSHFFGPRSFSFDAQRGHFWFGDSPNAVEGLKFYDRSQSAFIPSSDLFEPDSGLDNVNISFVASDGTVWVSSIYDREIASVKANLTSTSSATQAVTANIYPNPFHNTVQITTDQQLPATVSVMDFNGRTIGTHDLNVSTTTLDLSGYPSGIYLLRVQHAGGAGVFRVVKQ